MKIRFEFVLALTLTLPASVSAHAAREGFEAGRSRGALAQMDEEPQARPPERLTRYATEIDGDHSLDAATIAEKTFDRFALYTVRLEFASGREQSIAVTAPPGGLQPEIRDMSGDRIANDVVLTSKLLRAPLVVLLNDGHDHLTVVVSRGSFAAGEGRASGGQPENRASLLAPPVFRPFGLGSGRKLLPCGSRARLAPPRGSRLTELPGHASDIGRAPPAPSHRS